MKIEGLMPDPCVFHTDLAIAAPTRASVRRVDLAFVFHATETCRMTWHSQATAGEGRGISIRFCYRILIDTDPATADAVRLSGRRQHLTITSSCNGISRCDVACDCWEEGGTQKPILFATMYFGTVYRHRHCGRGETAREVQRPRVYHTPPSPRLSRAYAPRGYPLFWQRRALRTVSRRLTRSVVAARCSGLSTGGVVGHKRERLRDCFCAQRTLSRFRGLVSKVDVGSWGDNE